MSSYKTETEFPMFEKGDADWETLVELMDRRRMHENGYNGANYYNEMESMMQGMEDEDIPWCCKYTKRAFVKAWKDVQRMVENWHFIDQHNAQPDVPKIFDTSLAFRRQY